MDADDMLTSLVARVDQLRARADEIKRAPGPTIPHALAMDVITGLLTVLDATLAAWREDRNPEEDAE